MTSHTFFVSGTHCAACKLLIEDAVREVPGITTATVSLSNETLTVETTRSDAADTLAHELSSRISEHGYGVHTAHATEAWSWSEWLIAAVATTVIIVGFIALDKAGLASRINGDGATLATALMIGLVASVSTCLAVVGGLVLSVSATYAREGSGWKPQALFHAGRLGGFFVLGGLLGIVGERMHIGVYGSALLGAFVSVIMVLLAIHLLGVTRKVRALTLPASVSRIFTTAAGRTGWFAPVLLGAVTFFLPCGFTQSMQVVALSSGSALQGALTMGTFALGTLPVLALVSFGSLDLAKGKYHGAFFKAAGMLVLLFALFNLQNALAVFGLISPIVSL